METRDKSTLLSNAPTGVPEKSVPKERFGAYVVIPSKVYFDREISDKARLLYGLISCMANHKGYCWAKNSTLAGYLGVSEDKTVRRYLAELKEHGHITVEQANENGITVRKIYVSAVAKLQNRPVISDRPPGQSCPDRPVISDRHNITSNNIIPPIAPLEGGAVKKSKTSRRRQAGQPVELPENLEESFGAFWDAYPLHRDKQQARLRWLQIEPDNNLLAEILDAIKILKSSEAWSSGAIPLPSTFLYNRRWEDAEGLEPSSGGGMERW